MRRSLTLIIFFCLLVPVLKAQTGGDNVYEFLNLTHSGLVASLGGSNVSLFTSDLNMAYHNPALLDSAMIKNLALSYVNYFAGINYGMALYSWPTQRPGTFAAGLTYLNYGAFTEADASGEISGTFSASEYALSLIYSKKLDSLFSVGINFKPIISQLEKYNSLGFAFDVGASFQSRSGLFSAGLVIKNMGFQLTKYAGEERQQLPFEVTAGVSQRLAHAPLRFSLTLRHLEKFDITSSYNDSIASGSALQSSGFFENIMRHVITGVEFIPHRNFYMSAGYNYQRRRELQVESNISTVGFSWGFGISTTLLNIGFGRAAYHLAGSSNHISFILRPDLIYNKFRQ